jgi:hypothetical protein
VPFVYHSFKELCWEVNDINSSLNKQQKEFITKVFNYLKTNYTDSELRELAHEDLAWQKARQRKLKGGSDIFIYDREVLHYYQVLSRSLLKAMNIKC